MHEIKFRGKSSDNGEWVYGNFVYMQDLGDTYTTGIQMTSGDGYRPWASIKVDPETVGQYTGSKDSYKGDIVKWTSLNIDGEALGEITFLNGCWFVQGDKHSGRLDDCLTYEVIGNIYDNPELINS